MADDSRGDGGGTGVIAVAGLRGADDLVRIRRLVAAAATDVGLHPDRIDRLVVAVSEVATNAIVHAGGSATVTVATARGRMTVEVADRGSGFTPGPAPDPASPTRLDGRGLWMARQLCDQVDIESSGVGSTIRLTMLW